MEAKISNSLNVPFTITEDTVIPVYYEPMQYSADIYLTTLDKNGTKEENINGAIIRGTKPTYLDEEETAIICIPDDGYKFLKWKDRDNNQTISNNALLNYTVIKDLNIEAVVQESDLEISVKLIPQGVGSVSYTSE